MIHLFIDACVYIRGIMQPHNGFELTELQRLASQVRAGKALLLLPEVTGLELSKEWLNLHGKIDREIVQVKNSIRATFQGDKKKKPWNELGDIAGDIMRFLDQLAREKKNRAVTYHKAIMEIHHSTGVKTVPLTSDILLSTKRRLISDRMPRRDENSRNPESDMLIIESLAGYFGQANDDRAKLIFASVNPPDFALAYGSNDDEPPYCLHPYLAEALAPVSIYVSTFKELADEVDTPGSIPQPDKVQIERALERERAKPPPAREAEAVESLRNLNAIMYGLIRQQLQAEYGSGQVFETPLPSAEETKTPQPPFGAHE
jgi:hypothetical protein